MGDDARGFEKKKDPCLGHGQAQHKNLESVSWMLTCKHSCEYSQLTLCNYLQVKTCEWLITSFTKKLWRDLRVLATQLKVASVFFVGIGGLTALNFAILHVVCGFWYIMVLKKTWIFISTSPRSQRYQAKIQKETFSWQEECNIKVQASSNCCERR